MGNEGGGDGFSIRDLIGIGKRSQDAADEAYKRGDNEAGNRHQQTARLAYAAAGLLAVAIAASLGMPKD